MNITTLQSIRHLIAEQPDADSRARAFYSVVRECYDAVRSLAPDADTPERSSLGQVSDAALRHEDSMRDITKQVIHPAGASSHLKAAIRSDVLASSTAGGRAATICEIVAAGCDVIRQLGHSDEASGANHVQAAAAVHEQYMR